MLIPPGAAYRPRQSRPSPATGGGRFTLWIADALRLADRAMIRPNVQSALACFAEISRLTLLLSTIYLFMHDYIPLSRRDAIASRLAQAKR